MARFGEKLRTLRKQRGLTLQLLANAIRFYSYVAIGYLSEIEVGKKNPTLEFALKVSRLFGVPMDQLTKDELEIGGE